MTRPPVHGNNRQVQRGQALTEFLVVALVLVPLLIAVPLVGKYIDLMQTAEQASRYVAFEGMNRNTSGSWKTDDELAAEVRRRFFSRSDAPIKTGDTAGDFSADRNPLWTDHAGRPLLDRFNEQVTVSTGTADQSGIRDGSTYVPALDLPTANLYSGTVTVRPSNVPGFAPFDAFDLSITRRT
ncbi:MAG TPA: hypothetical protein VFP68_09865, partial [Burkholderiaceae bacterium]|nr:hypothetical protein [Burkholderiaceae bacterium]